MEATCDRSYKQRAVIEFLVAVKETVGNIHKRLSNVDGNVAVDGSTVGRWTEKSEDVQVGKAQIFDVLHWKVG
jgi:hypothetical protein